MAKSVGYAIGYDPLMEETRYEGGSQDTKRDEDSPSVHHRPPRRNWRRRINVCGIVTFFLGSILLFFSVSFLVFIWAASANARMGLDPGETWRRIVFSNWATRTITICSVLVRAVMSFQLAMLTAMLASMLIEGGILMHNAPLISMVRGIWVSPYGVMFSTFRDAAYGPNAWKWVMLLLLSAIGLASQFTSTILLTDFADATVLGNGLQGNLSYAMRAGAATFGYTDVWHSAPESYARFAEYSEPPAAAPADANYDDTGLSLRAFVPFRSRDDRMALRSYSGPATVINSQVTCISPDVEIETINVDTITSDYSYLFIYGSVGLNTTNAPSLANPQGSQRLNFSCVIPGDLTSNAGAAPANTDGGSATGFLDVPGLSTLSASLCLLNTRLISPSYRRPTMPFIKTPLYEWYSSSILLYINTTTRDSWRPLFGNRGTIGRNLTWAFERKGPWTHARSKDLDATELFFSACFTSVGGWDYLIDAKSDDMTDSSVQEPALLWNRSETGMSGSYDFDGIRMQLGTTMANNSLEDRGLLSLRQRNWTNAWLGNRSTASVLKWGATTYTLPKFLFQLNTTDEGIIDYTTSPCGMMNFNFKGTYGHLIPHRAHVAVFLDTLLQTHSPARAMQAVLTIAAQMTYYDASAQFTVPYRSSFLMSGVWNIPVQFKGLVGVLALCAIHYVLLIAITALFFSTTRHTSLGSRWQAASQMVGAYTADILAGASDWTDGEVRATLREGGWRFVVGRSVESERNELVLKRD